MIRSFWKAIPVLSLALSAGAYAQNELALQDLAAKDKTNRANKQQMVPCGVVEGNDCYARACAQSMGGAFELDFLWWRAENSGFALGWEIEDQVTATPGGVTLGAGNFASGSKLLRAQPEWDPGFRLGAGWNSCYDRWDLFVDWTWYKNHANETATAGTETTVPTATNGVGLYTVNSGVLNSFALVGPYQQMKGSWKLWHNCFDAELGRAFYITRKLSLRPHWGARAAVNKQKGAASFYNNSASVGAIATVNPLNINDRVTTRNKFWGFGPRTGVHANWHLGKGFSLIGKTSVSLLFGQSKWSSFDEVTPFGGPRTKVAKTRGQDQTLVPNLQLFLGLQWASCFNCEEIWAGLNVGWEANYWGNQYSVCALPQSIGANNALTMEGLTVNFHLDY